MSSDARDVGIQPARHRGRSQTRIGHSDPDPGDCWAPAPKRWTCQDRAGYRRKRHSYVVEARDGRRCVFCGQPERMVAL